MQRVCRSAFIQLANGTFQDPCWRVCHLEGRQPWKIVHCPSFLAHLPPYCPCTCFSTNDHSCLQNQCKSAGCGCTQISPYRMPNLQMPNKFSYIIHTVYFQTCPNTTHSVEKMCRGRGSRNAFPKAVLNIRTGFPCEAIHVRKRTLVRRFGRSNGSFLVFPQGAEKSCPVSL